MTKAEIRVAVVADWRRHLAEVEKVNYSGVALGMRVAELIDGMADEIEAEIEERVRSEEEQ
jgi:hypothetical protein